jgi:hypothetical protein
LSRRVNRRAIDDDDGVDGDALDSLPLIPSTLTDNEPICGTSRGLDDDEDDNGDPNVYPLETDEEAEEEA